MTSIERETLGVLQTLGLSPIYNNVLNLKDGYVFPDFQIPNCNIVIECNGAYWHMDQEKELERIRRYKESGYFPIVLEEDMIKQGPRAIIKTLLSYPSVREVLPQSTTLKLQMPTTSS